MHRANKGVVRNSVPGVLTFVFLSCLLVAGTSRADYALRIYPDAPAVFRYDTSRYQTVSPEDARFNAAYGVGGTMLWDAVENRVALEVYRAPYLTGFEPSPDGRNEYVTMINDFNLVIDGFGEAPRRLGGLYLRFIPDPPPTRPLIQVDGAAIDRLIVPVAGFDALTPTGDGHYEGLQSAGIVWSASTGIRISVFADKDGDGVYSGGVPCFGVYVRDGSVPTRRETWGGLKALYR